MKSVQILQLLHAHDRSGLALVGGGEVMTLDGEAFALVPELLRLANLGASAEMVRTHNRQHDDAPVAAVFRLHDATWPRPTP